MNCIYQYTMHWAVLTLSGSSIRKLTEYQILGTQPCIGVMASEMTG